MAESVLSTINFSMMSDSSGNIKKETLFITSKDGFLSAIKSTVTVAGGVDGKNHRFFLAVGNRDRIELNTTYLNSPENITANASFDELSWLLVAQYIAVINIGGFAPYQNVTVQIELLELATNLADVTSELIYNEAEVALGNKAIGFGFSETSITEILDNNFKQKQVLIGTSQDVSIGFTILNSNINIPFDTPLKPEVVVDVANERLTLKGTLFLTLSRLSIGGGLLANVFATIEINCIPAMVTTSMEQLQLQVTDATLVDGHFSIDILNPGLLAPDWANENDFRDEIKQIVKSTANIGDPKYGILLKNYIATRPFPDDWSRTDNLKLNFLKFSYKTVITHDIEIGYLFVLFSIQSLGIPIPCYCEHDTFNAIDNFPIKSITTDLFIKKAHRILGKTKVTYTRKDLAEKYLTNRQKKHIRNIWTPPKSNSISAASKIVAFGVGKNGFNEIVTPYGNAGDEHHEETGGGPVYGFFRIWYTARLDGTKILSNGVEAAISLAGEGMAKAAVRDECGDDVASASASLSISIDSTTVSWAMSESDEQGTAGRILVGIPSVHIGRINVEFVSPCGPPIDNIASDILIAISNYMAPSLDHAVEAKAHLRFYNHEKNRKYIPVDFIKANFFEDKAIVIFGARQTYSELHKPIEGQD